ncbi:MAG: 30S ribosomal protein S17 [Chloroflexota bacterium]
MRERKRELVGRVVSDKMQKTVVVAVQNLRRHRLYQRTVRRTKKYMVHNEQDEAKLGDLVRIRESRPLSRHKHWQVITILERAAERGKAVILPEAVAGPDMAGVGIVDAADAAAVESAPGEEGAASGEAVSGEPEERASR